MSEDPGERWYSLIQAEGDLDIIARCLRFRAAAYRNESKSRQWAGQRNAVHRQELRATADRMILFARRAESLARTQSRFCGCRDHHPHAEGATHCYVCDLPIRPAT